jgi:hypothetical protein
VHFVQWDIAVLLFISLLLYGAAAPTASLYAMHVCLAS